MMDATAHDQGYLIDAGSVVCFGDVHPASAVGADGDVVYLLYDPQHQCPEVGCCCVVTPHHEGTGKLPTDVRRRVNQCRQTHGDWRCSRPVPVGEQFCFQHRRVVADG